MNTAIWPNVRDWGKPEFVGEDGLPVERTKHTHPYSYDPFVVWEHPTVKANGSAYTDRMFEWDCEKYDKCRREIFGDTAQLTWGQERHEQIEKFCRLYFETPDLILTKVVEYCNLASGYPVWRFDYKTK